MLIESTTAGLWFMNQEIPPNKNILDGRLKCEATTFLDTLRGDDVMIHVTGHDIVNGSSEHSLVTYRCIKNGETIEKIVYVEIKR